MSKAAFFLGSGISYASGAARVQDMNPLILEDRWYSHTDSRFYPDPEGKRLHEAAEAKRAQEFLRRLHKRIAPHLKARENREPHYEDLYAATTQVLQDETFEIVNPMIADSLAGFKTEVADLLPDQRTHIDDNQFASLADRACQLIQWGVAYGLARAKKPVGMDVIADVAKAVDDLDIFTLNHECLIEAQLRGAGVNYVDGFGEVNGEAVIFNGTWRFDDRAVRLMKLHGSTDWYLFQFKEWSQYARVAKDVDHAKDRDGKFLSLMNPIPRFLTGTTVKEQAYGHDIFGELMMAFRQRSSEHRTIICCGYGFADKGINQRLNQWLLDQKDNKLVLLDPRGPALVQAPRFWQFRWDRYAKAGKVVVLPKWLSQCTVDDLRPYFEP